MCGVTGIILSGSLSQQQIKTHVGNEIFEALGVLQHRGQDAAGIITCAERGRMLQCKGNGLVRDVFNKEKITYLRGYMGIGHVRYPTAGTSSTAEAQPFYVNSPYGVVLAHNGNLTNASEIRHYLDQTAHRHVNTSSDSELMLNILADNLQRTGKSRISDDDVFSAISSLFEVCKGGYACAVMIAGFGVVAFRDPHGIRPLVYGQREVESCESSFAHLASASATQEQKQLYDYMVASESVALDALDYTDITDLRPGEAIIFSRRAGVDPVKRQLTTSYAFAPCIFEYVYMARQDSIIDGISVYHSRLEMGRALAPHISKLGRKIDVVIPVPDTARAAAIETAHALCLPFREGFNKNRYIGRTFIMPRQNVRLQSVKRKLNPMPCEFRGKNVLLVDDSIVRGTTSREIVQMVRKAGALSVIFASCAPQIRHVNVYGIDIPTRKELIAHGGKTDDEIASLIGADAAVFLPLEDLIKAVRKYNPKIQCFECSVFDGKYITGNVTEEYIKNLEDERDMLRVSSTGVNVETVGLHNEYPLDT